MITAADQKNFLVACARGSIQAITAFVKSIEGLAYPPPNAITLRRADLPKYLTCPKIFPGEVLGSPVCLAVISGKPNALRAVLNAGRFDPCAAKNYAIRVAARFGKTGMVRLLLEDGRANPEAWQSIALTKACKYGHVQVVRLLLEHGAADPNDDCFLPLIVACEQGHLDIIELLLHDPRLRLPDAGPLALQAAISSRQYSVITRLLQDSRFSPSGEPFELCLLASDLFCTRLLIKDTRITHKVIGDTLNMYLERHDFDPNLACLVFAHIPAPFVHQDVLDRNPLYRVLSKAKQIGFHFYPNHVYSPDLVDLVIRCKATTNALTVDELDFFLRFMDQYFQENLEREDGHPNPEILKLTIQDTLDYVLGCARRFMRKDQVRTLLGYFVKRLGVAKLTELAVSAHEIGSHHLKALYELRIETLAMRMSCHRLEFPAELGLLIQEMRLIEFMRL